MFENHTIGRIAGIPVRASLVLGYLLAIWAVWGASQGHAAQTILLIVVSVLLLLLHEVGHALVARRMGLEVIDIVIGPLGMARISDLPEDSRTEAWVAAAGPLVNLGLAALAAPLLLLPGPPADHYLQLFGISVPIGTSAKGVAALFVFINVAYGLLNLLPAFPLDGGRILRAFLGRGGRSWVAATDRATSIGSVLAWTIIVLSLLQGACFVSLVGFFVLWAGLRERWVVRMRHRASQFGGERGRFAGWESILREMQQRGEADPPAADGDADRESRTVTLERPDVGREGRGFSDDDVEALESFRGRLQKPNAEGDAG